MDENIDRQATLGPLVAALEHISVKGNLLLFAPDRTQRMQIMKAMTDLELVAWNAAIKKYEMTWQGRQCLAQYRQR